MLTLPRRDVDLIANLLTEVPFKVSAPVISRISQQMTGAAAR
ncbi:hypothetical protein [Acetobacter sp. DsW_063]|nr:hypothetical protein [Acetobacter sp. DsW_063]